MVETRGWNPTASRSAVEALTETGHGLRPSAFARVVGAYADAETEDGRPRFTTPALLPEPGPHWDKTPIAARPTRPKCAEHQQHYPCQACEERPVTSRPDNFKQLVHQAREQARTERTTP